MKYEAPIYTIAVTKTNLFSLTRFFFENSFCQALPFTSNIRKHFPTSLILAYYSTICRLVLQACRAICSHVSRANFDCIHDAWVKHSTVTLMTIYLMNCWIAAIGTHMQCPKCFRHCPQKTYNALDYIEHLHMTDQACVLGQEIVKSLWKLYMQFIESQYCFYCSSNDTCIRIIVERSFSRGSFAVVAICSIFNT